MIEQNLNLSSSPQSIVDQQVEVASPTSFVGWTEDQLYPSVPARFEAMVRRYPDRLALSGQGRTFTYDQLNRSANRLARAILDRRGQGAEAVVILMEQGVELILAIMAVLKAGKSYVPLDPAYPPPRIKAVLADSGARLMITNRQNYSQAAALVAPDELLNLADIEPGLSDENLNLPIPPEAHLNIIYTSGSTGQPKGVLQTHRNVIFDTRESTQALKFCPEDRFGLIVPCTFGASVSDIFGALLNGGSIFPYDLKRAGLEQMARWFKESRISVTHAVPTVFRQWMGILVEADCYPEMRVIKLGGEPLLKHDFELFKRHFSEGCILRNTLGTTETYMATCYLLDRRSRLVEPVIPVGYPMAGRELFILDEQGQPLGPGEVGQIAVKSSYLSPGYWRQPELTAAAFLPDPQGSEARIYLTGDMGRLRPDGCLEHLGRKDDLVKIRGQRVELAEVEMALLALEEVREAVVVAQKRPEGDNRLVAYLIPRLQPPPSVTELRAALTQTLPDHMIPAAFVMMERFPLLPFGKVDRRALPAPDTARPDLSVAYQPPQTPTETSLVGLMAQVLKLDRVGIHDNFFELGGDSLLAAQLVTRIQTEFGLELPVVSLFETPTVAGLARLMIKQQADNLQDLELDQLLAELESLDDEQAHQLLDLEG